MKPGAAQLRDPEALKRLRAALIEFSDEIAGASAEADGQIGRATQWISREQPARWKAELRRREDNLGRKRSELTRKKGSGVGAPPTAMEERKAVEKAQRGVDEAQSIMRSLNSLATTLDRAASQYRGRAQRLNSIAQRELPMGVHALDQMLDAIDRYLSDAAPEMTPGARGQRAMESRMGRAAGDGKTGEPAVGWEALRARTCADEERFGLDAVGADELPDAPSGDDPSADDPGREDRAAEQSRVRAAVGDMPRRAVAADERVVIAEGAVSALAGGGAVYLERVETGLRGDSGWFVGNADGLLVDAVGAEALGADDAVRAALVGAIERAVPAVAGLLTLAPGSLVVLLGGRVVAVLDADDRVVFGGADDGADADGSGTA